MLALLNLPGHPAMPQRPCIVQKLLNDITRGQQTCSQHEIVDDSTQSQTRVRAHRKGPKKRTLLLLLSPMWGLHILLLLLLNSPVRVTLCVRGTSECVQCDFTPAVRKVDFEPIFLRAVLKHHRMSGSRAPRCRVEDALKGGYEDGYRDEAQGEDRGRG